MHNPFQNIDQHIWNSLADKPDEPRRYIGASIVGHSCDRRIWFDWKGIIDSKQFADPEKWGQKKEIYQRGNEEEEIFIKKLHSAGYDVIKRQASFSAYDGRLKGHCDGIIVDEKGNEYLFEFKTMMETTFNRVKKYGIEKSHFHYTTQIQLYMHFIDFKSESNDKKALIVCQNKNRDYERYQEFHRINPQQISGTLSKVERILSYEDQMPGLLCAPEAPSFVCKMCDYFKFCYPNTETRRM
jgi:hypothetical protein